MTDFLVNRDKHLKQSQVFFFYKVCKTSLPRVPFFAYCFLALRSHHSALSVLLLQLIIVIQVVNRPFLMTWSHGTKYTLLDGKWRSGTSKKQRNLHFLRCKILQLFAPLRQLLSSIVYFVPCDQVMQRLYSPIYSFIPPPRCSRTPSPSWFGLPTFRI